MNNGVNNTPKLINEPDDLVEGFYRLSDPILNARAPKIKFLPKFHERTSEQQITYLVKLASTMNYAAKLIQDERDALVQLLTLKEEQLEKMNISVRQNNQMLQSEMTRMNELRQEFYNQIQEKNNRIRELEQSLSDGDNS